MLSRNCLNSSLNTLLINRLFTIRFHLDPCALKFLLIDFEIDSSLFDSAVSSFYLLFEAMSEAYFLKEFKMFFITFDFGMRRYRSTISSSSEKQSGFFKEESKVEKGEDIYAYSSLSLLFSVISILPICYNYAEESFKERGHGYCGYSLREPASDETAEISGEKSISSYFYFSLITTF